MMRVDGWTLLRYHCLFLLLGIGQSKAFLAEGIRIPLVNDIDMDKPHMRNHICTSVQL
jgi:hypothetical protein